MTEDTDFSALAHEAAQADAEAIGPRPVAPDAAPDAETPVNDVDEARAIIGLVCIHTNAIFPFIAPIYTDDVQGRLAAVTAPLMKKYGITAGGLFDSYKEEIAFGMVAVPLTIATVQAFKAQRPESAQEANAEAAQAVAA